MTRHIGWMAGLRRYHDPNDPGAGAGASGTAPNEGDLKERVAFLEAEAKKAFRARDELKQKLRDYETKGVSEDERAELEALRKQREEAEEKRKREAGEFDSLRQSLLEKHNKEIEAERQRAAQAEQKWRSTVKGRAFADATDIFGKDALTIYQPAVAERVFGDYVDLDPDTGAIVVKDPDGHVIVDAKTGRPASFSAAMRELIESLPDKDYHLRGSGKTGSGSSGGSDPAKPADLDALIAKAQAGDASAVAALRRRQASQGGMVMGAGFSKIRNARAS